MTVTARASIELISVKPLGLPDGTHFDELLVRIEGTEGTLGMGLRSVIPASDRATARPLKGTKVGRVVALQGDRCAAAGA